MVTLNVINLIQAGIVAIGVLGCLLLWRVAAFRGLSGLLALIALAAVTNILEETGVTRDIYLISPVFILLFGPATYLAAKLAIEKRMNAVQLWHLFPVLPLLFFTSHVHVVIAIGTLWRVVYTVFTARLLLLYKRRLDAERSDSDEFSLLWLVWLLVLLTGFNLIDLMRLNIQPLISAQLNLLGQGVNNLVWLLACGVMVLQFTKLSGLPNSNPNSNSISNHKAHREVKPREEKAHDSGRSLNKNDESINEFRAIFEELHELMQKNKWYLTPRLTLSDVSDLTGLQTRDISRAINLHANQSFNDYINAFRVQAVCDSLKTMPQTSLTDIALQAGFSSKASFNKVFKASLRITPSEYRARQGNIRHAKRV